MRRPQNIVQARLPKNVPLTPQLCKTRYDSCDSFTPQAFFFCGHLRHATLASECTFPFFGLSCLTLPLQVVLPKLCSGFSMWRDPLEAGASTRTSCNPFQYLFHTPPRSRMDDLFSDVCNHSVTTFWLPCHDSCL